MRMMSRPITAALLLLITARSFAASPTTLPALVVSAKSGNWSDVATWQDAHVPQGGERVLVRAGDRVVFDVKTPQPLWSVHVAGTLAFATDRDTQLDVGLILVRPGAAGDETELVGDPRGLHAHHHQPPADAPPAVLQIGSAQAPVTAAHQALVRLTWQPGMDAKIYPALICYGGTLDLHGAPLARSWTKLRTRAAAGETTLTLQYAVNGWRADDRVIVPTTIEPKMFDGDGKVIENVRVESQTEERTIKAVEGQLVTLDKPLAYDHDVDGDFAGEVADLSRNVVIESADADSDGGALRGHTMVHGGSAATISNVEFRHLGKPGLLGRYALHFHAAGDSLRGSSVVGCSIWDSANRWMTVHGTNYLIVRDNVGYRSLGHGFFLEDGTEVYNVFDRNLAVQAMHADPLPGQLLPFDKNDGAGFWWANSHNTFTNNVAAECDQYGYRFEMGKPPAFDPVLPVRQADGSSKAVDVRTLPFVRFEGNEAHSMRRYALNLGGFRLVAGNDAYSTGDDGKRKFDPANVLIGDVGDVGPDLGHPFVIKDFKAWRSQWAFHSAAPSVLIDGLNTFDVSYGIWRSRSDHAQYKNLSMRNTHTADIYNPWGGPGDFKADFNQSIRIVDDEGPQSVITGLSRTPYGDLHVTGTTSDNRQIQKIVVNGREVRMAAKNFGEWSIDLSGKDASGDSVTAVATDAAGNTELTPHTVKVPKD